MKSSNEIMHSILRRQQPNWEKDKQVSEKPSIQSPMKKKRSGSSGSRLWWPMLSNSWSNEEFRRQFFQSIEPDRCRGPKITLFVMISLSSQIQSKFFEKMPNKNKTRFQSIFVKMIMSLSKRNHMLKTKLFLDKNLQITLIAKGKAKKIRKKSCPTLSLEVLDHQASQGSRYKLWGIPTWNEPKVTPIYFRTLAGERRLLWFDQGSQDGSHIFFSSSSDPQKLDFTLESADGQDSFPAKTLRFRPRDFHCYPYQFTLISCFP